MESWLNSSVKDRESFSSRDYMGCTEVCSSCSTEIEVPLYMKRFSQRSQYSCLVMMDTSESLTMLGRKIQTLLDVSQEAKRTLLVGTFILVFLSIFTKRQALSPYEALNSAHISKCQRDVRPSVQKRWRTMAFSRVSTGDSVIP